MLWPSGNAPSARARRAASTTAAAHAQPNRPRDATASRWRWIAGAPGSARRNRGKLDHDVGVDIPSAHPRLAGEPHLVDEVDVPQVLALGRVERRQVLLAAHHLD